MEKQFSLYPHPQKTTDTLEEVRTKMANDTSSVGNNGKAAGMAVVPIIVVTAFWVIVGGIVPCLIRGPNKR